MFVPPAIFMTWFFVNIGVSANIVSLISGLFAVLGGVMITSENNYIVLIGAAFKENTDDLRDSPTLKIYDRIQNIGIDIVIFDKNINLTEDYQSISSFEDLKDNCLYVEMFPDISEERKQLVSKINTFKNSYLFKMWK